MLLQTSGPLHQCARYAVAHLDWQFDDPGVGGVDVVIVGYQVDRQARLGKLGEAGLKVRLQLRSSEKCTWRSDTQRPSIDPCGMSEVAFCTAGCP